MRINRAKELARAKDGTTYSTAFRNLGHGTYYRISFKPHEQRELDGDSLTNASRRRRGKILQRAFNIKMASRG